MPAAVRRKVEPDSLSAKLSRLLVGQPEAIEAVVPFVQMHQAGLAPSGRPIGVVLLLGPTGSGKTRTAEVLAEVLHGSTKKLLKIDCGEFQLDHEVAKLIGSPPGYLGHRETVPMLTQAKLNCVVSNQSEISIVLFDEIEKAAHSMARLLLGVLDKATLRLGDNTEVSFENSLIFLTSNIGSAEMTRLSRPEYGLEKFIEQRSDNTAKVKRTGLEALKKRFSPEFINRLDATIVYRSLDRSACESILDQILTDFQHHIHLRLKTFGFYTKCTGAARTQLLKQGISTEYGARELKRTVQRHFFQPLGAMVANKEIRPGCTAMLDVRDGKFKISLRGCN